MSQPMPEPGRENVKDWAITIFISMLRDRTEKGIETYGTPLQTFNGRDALVDAMEECVDLWQYLCQLYVERQSKK